MNWVDAQFKVPHGYVTVGPFDSEGDADAFGEAHTCAEAGYVGTARRLGRQELAAEIARLRAGGGPESARSWRRTGVISRWSGTSGFATDSEGTSWFVSRDDLPAGRAELDVHTAIAFSGAPDPAPGKKYPRAYSIQLAGDDHA